MSPLMPEVHQALLAAARRRADPSRRRRVSRRTAVLAFTAALAGGSATAATLWQPQLGDDHRGHPSVAVDRVPPEQAAALGVLRRKQTDADRGPRVQAVLKLLPAGEVDGAHVNAVRLLAERPNGALVLVPMERVGRHDPGYPSSIRRDMLCVLQYTDGLGAGQICGTAADLRAGRISGSAGENGKPMQVGQGNSAHNSPEGPRMRFYQLVPDGVARVELTLRDRSLHVVDVHNNAVELSLPPGIVSVSNTRWLDATGQEVSKDR